MENIIPAPKGATEKVRKLIAAGFFTQPKKFSQIKKELNKTDIIIKPSALNGILSKMAGRNELMRIGSRRFYMYVKPREGTEDNETEKENNEKKREK